MTQHSDEQTVFRRYLLWELDESEREQIEERLLSEAEISEQLAIAQNDLFDDFAAGSLPEDERERFKTYFLTTPEHVRKLKFATALDRYVTAKTGSTAPSAGSAVDRTNMGQRILAALLMYKFKLAFSFALLLLAVSAVMWVVNTKWLPGRITNEQNRQALGIELASLNNQLSNDSESLNKANGNTSTVPSFTLRPTLTREAVGAQKADLPRSAALVQLHLELTSNEYKNYRVVLQTDEGHDIATIAGLNDRAADDTMVVVLNLPVNHFPLGDYQIKLTGSSDNVETDIGLYPFRVVDK